VTYPAGDGVDLAIVGVVEDRADGGLTRIAAGSAVRINDDPVE
jgi:hypothetical protein